VRLARVLIHFPLEIILCYNKKFKELRRCDPYQNNNFLLLHDIHIVSHNVIDILLGEHFDSHDDYEVHRIEDILQVRELSSGCKTIRMLKIMVDGCQLIV
jgi:hypothetical protein